MIACLIGGLAAFLLACSKPPHEGRPSVILVVVDTLRADHLTQSGYPRPTSAALEPFAGRATRFTHAQAPSSWTAPSTASLLTGLSTARHGTTGFGSALSGEVVTLAELLRASGWRTAGFSFNPHVSRTTNFDQGFERFEDYRGPWRDYPQFEEMVTGAKHWLAGRAEQPIFLYLHPMNVHGPYRVPEGRRDRLLGREPTPLFEYKKGHAHAVMARGEIGRRREVTEAYLESLKDQYDSAVLYTMETLGAFFDFLEEEGLYDPSLIVVTADHGEELFDHGGFIHGYSLHREVVSVPLLIKMPGSRSGAVVETRVSLMDLFPTIMEVSGVKIDHEVDGRSLVPLLKGGQGSFPESGDRPFLYEVSWPERCVARGILSGKYKLIEIERNYEGVRNALRLFDIEQDPFEKTDVSKALPEVAEELSVEMKARFEYDRGRALARPPNRRHEMEEEKLRALGYL